MAQQQHYQQQQQQMQQQQQQLQQQQQWLRRTQLGGTDSNVVDEVEKTVQSEAVDSRCISFGIICYVHILMMMGV